MGELGLSFLKPDTIGLPDGLLCCMELAELDIPSPVSYTHLDVYKRQVVAYVIMCKITDPAIS